MKWWLHWWLLLPLVLHNITCKNSGQGQGGSQSECKGSRKCKDIKNQGNGRGAAKYDAECCMEDINSILDKGNGCDSIQALQDLEDVLEITEVNETTSLSVGSLVSVLHKPRGPFKGLKIYANENEAMSDNDVTNRKVSVQLPEELDAGPNNTIVFCLLTGPKTSETLFGTADVLYENRVVGLSVRGKNVSGLQEHVNITMDLTMGINETQIPKCVFLNFSTSNFSSDGCLTQWKRGQSQVTCSCDHLTYFGVLMVPTNSDSVSPQDVKILSHITLIGCSLSLFALVITVFLFITNSKLRADVSMKVHINLAIALILLNVHFLPIEIVAALPSTGLCFYMALSLHYYLLATFSWMALEGFNIYLLLIRVFNAYVKRYLLKLSVVGWGIPAVIVSLVVIIDRKAYGRVSLHSSNSSSSEICYITNNIVMMVTTVGVFSLVFIFNLVMLGMTVRLLVSLRHSREHGQSGRFKQDICTLLGVTTLLGITWGLVFFSFGYLTIVGLYLFSILNPLQGFFIFLWFVMSLRKIRNSATKTSRETNTSNG